MCLQFKHHATSGKASQKNLVSRMLASKRKYGCGILKNKRCNVAFEISHLHVVINSPKTGFEQKFLKYWKATYKKSNQHFNFDFFFSFNFQTIPVRTKLQFYNSGELKPLFLSLSLSDASMRPTDKRSVGRFHCPIYVLLMHGKRKHSHSTYFFC